jgi:hypothetical protein
VVAHELERNLGPDAFDRLDVVATEEDAEIDKLVCVVNRRWSECARGPGGAADRLVARTWLMVMLRPSRILSRWISAMGIFFCSENVRCRRRTGVLNVIVSISSDPTAKT